VPARWGRPIFGARVGLVTLPATVSPGPVRRRVGFLRAAAAPWRGLYFLFRNPASWPLAMVPVIVALVIISVASGLSLAYVPDLVASWIGDTSTWYGTAGRVALQILATIVLVVVAMLAGAILAQPLSGPALERLVRLREEHLGLPPRESSPFWIDVWRSSRSALIGSFGVPVILTITVLEIAIPGSSIVLLPLKVLISGLFVSWDLLDYPLSVRSFRMRDRLRFVFTHKQEVLGFGVSLAVVFLLPCMQLLLLPAGVVGATELVRDIEEADGPDRPIAR
jgi:CysZ protein